MAKDNHHFVPQGYLRGFTIEDEKSLIWEYDKVTGEISHQPKSIRDICSDYHYYAQKREDGSVDKESIENIFHVIEDKAPRVIRNIKFPGTGKKIVLTDEEQKVLSYFVAIQLFRVPNFRDGYEERYRKLIETGLDQIIIEEKQNGILPMEIEKIYNRDGLIIDVESFVSLEPMISFAGKGCLSLLKKVWYFATPAKDMTFVVSDNPVYFQVPEKYRERNSPSLGPLHPLSEVTIPLRKDLLLVFSPSVEFSVMQYDLLNCTACCLDKFDTKNFNRRTALAASRYVYSSENSKALARMVGKLKGMSQKVVV